jgi:hypothetical protein
MNVRHWMGVGAAVALLVGGCADHPGGAPTPAGTGPATPAGGPADDGSRWEARAGHPTPQQVAARAAAYAAAMDTPTPAAAAGDGPAHPRATGAPGTAVPSGVHFDEPPATGPSVAAMPATGPTGRVLPAPVVAAPALPPDPRVGVLRSAVNGSALGDMPRAVDESADFAPTANGPASTDPLGKQLARRARDNPRDVSAQFDYQLYAMLQGDEAGATLASAAALPSDERDVFSAVVDGVRNYRSTVRDNPTLPPTQQVRPLADMLDRVRSQTDLSISGVALCTKVSGFGLYDAFPTTRFPVGRPSKILVYFQLDNVQPKLTATGMWETRLSQQVWLLTADGADRGKSTPRQPAPDLCHERRRDYFGYELIVLPATLRPGPYRLKVSVTDLNTDKVAESDVGLTVGGI